MSLGGEAGEKGTRRGRAEEGRESEGEIPDEGGGRRWLGGVRGR